MKIIYDGQIFGWQRYGGISRLFSKIILNLSKYKSIDLKVLGNYYKCEYFTENEKNIFLNSKYLKKGFEIPGKFLQILNRPRREITSDIFHETYYDGYSAKLSKNTIRVITVFDTIQEKFPQYNYFYNNILNSKKKSILRADHIISISNSTKKDLIEFYNINPEKISVVHLGHELNSLDEGKRLIEEDYILYVGNRRNYKNFILLVKSVSNLNLQGITIVAFGGEKVSQNESKFYKKYNVKIKYLRGDDYVLSNLYKYALVFVLTSFYEGFGIPPLEAMSKGCPTICSNTSSIPEVVGNASLLFNPSRIDSLSLQLNKIFFDHSLRKKLIKLGYLRSKLFSWEKCSKETYEVYKKLF